MVTIRRCDEDEIGLCSTAASTSAAATTQLRPRHEMTVVPAPFVVLQLSSLGLELGIQIDDLWASGCGLLD